MPFRGPECKIPLSQTSTSKYGAVDFQLSANSSGLVYPRIKCGYLTAPEIVMVKVAVPSVLTYMGQYLIGSITFCCNCVFLKNKCGG